MHKALSQKMAELTGVAEKQGDIGLELEIEGERLPTEITGWDIHSETSLRGKGGRTINRDENQFDTPREYVTARPVLYRNLLPKLRTLNAALTARGVTVDITPRASTHIHLNMGAETLQTFLAFILTFCVAEPLLLRLCGPLRNGNLFCLPSYETGELAHAVRSIVKKVVKGKITPVYWPSRGKYACLNLDPMVTQGSVEVRCFPNSIDPYLIDSWARWLVTMRDTARSLNIGEALSTWYDRPSALTDSIFGYGLRDRLESVSSPQSSGQLVQFGVENAYEVYRAMKALLTGKEDAEVDVRGEEPEPEGLALDTTLLTPRREWTTRSVAAEQEW
jgi:hypothetical protein